MVFLLVLFLQKLRNMRACALIAGVCAPYISYDTTFLLMLQGKNEIKWKNLRNIQLFFVQNDEKV